MSVVPEVPLLSDLNGLPLEVVALEEPGAVSVTAWANDGAVVMLIWDTIAASVHLRWVEAEEVRLTITREGLSKVSVREERGQIEFWVWSDAIDFGGQLVVRVGDRVNVSDAILRR